MKYVPTSTSIGAILGLYYSIKKQQTFWGTAGFVLLFSLGGAGIGYALNNFTNKN